jgi:hypothetical protein
MTEHQVLLAQALERCTFLPASIEKRFANSMAARSRMQSPPALTEKQSALMQQLAWRFRRQLPAELVPASKPQ